MERCARFCPGLVILPGSQPIYRCFADRVWVLCREVAPAVETYLDDAYLDLTETPAARDPGQAVSDLRRRVRRETGLSVSAGIGPSRMIARLASKAAKPDGQRQVLPDEVEAFIVDRPVTDLPGVGHKSADLLHKINVRTVRDLREVPRELLVELFGKNGSAIYDRARGHDTRAIVEREVPRTISRETTFHQETTDLREVHGMLHYLVERAIKAVRELGIAARTMALKVRYADMKQSGGQRRLSDAANFTSPVFDAAMDLLRRLHTRRVALRLIGVTLSGFILGNTNQLELFAEEKLRSDRLARAMDEIRRRIGFSAITAGKSLELLGALKQDEHGFVLRTPSLTK